MPYDIIKLPKKNRYKVVNKKSKKVFAHNTSKKNAESQVRLLNAIENNKKFILRTEKRRVPKKPRKTVKKRSASKSPSK